MHMRASHIILLTIFDASMKYDATKETTNRHNEVQQTDEFFVKSKMNDAIWVRIYSFLYFFA